MFLKSLWTRRSRVWGKESEQRHIIRTKNVIEGTIFDPMNGDISRKAIGLEFDHCKKTRLDTVEMVSFDIGCQGGNPGR